MLKRIKRFLGLRGSWKWACKMMDRGHTVFRTTDTGSAVYKLDSEGQRRIVWTYSVESDGGGYTRFEWKNANIFLSDFECVDWSVKE